MTRIAPLDYLRGLCAIGIMIYHYLVFSGIETFTSDDFLRRVGYYGVSIFYILSGLTLHLVYENRFNITDFFIKRFFRIFPLLWVVLLCYWLIVPGIKIYNLLFTASGLFSVFGWWNYVGTGVWSIGNELSFYLIFPLFILPRKKYWNLILAVPIFSVYIWFAFHRLDPFTWRDYVNPLNQLGLFYLGFLLGYLKAEINESVSIVIIIFYLLLFTFYQVDGPPENLVTGVNRIVFTCISAFLVYGFCKLKISIPLLQTFGEISYSIYLIHPLVWMVVPEFSPWTRVIVCIISTIAVSMVTYRLVEKPAIKLGSYLIKSRYDSLEKIKRWPAN